MVIGNWNVTETNIEWNVGPLKRFSIPADKLNATTTRDDKTYYDWLLKATDQDWLTQNDLYDLNYAFIYALGKKGLDFDYEIFDETLEWQYQQFDDEDDDDNFES